MGSSEEGGSYKAAKDEAQCFPGPIGNGAGTYPSHIPHGRAEAPEFLEELSAEHTSPCTQRLHPIERLG